MNTETINNCTISGLEEHPLGCTVLDSQTIFRLFAPKAHSVTVIIYPDYKSETGIEIPLEQNQDGIWESIIQDTFSGNWYAYKI